MFNAGFVAAGKTYSTFKFVLSLVVIAYILLYFFLNADIYEMQLTVKYYIFICIFALYSIYIKSHLKDIRYTIYELHGKKKKFTISIKTLNNN